MAHEIPLNELPIQENIDINEAPLAFLNWIIPKIFNSDVVDWENLFNTQKDTIDIVEKNHDKLKQAIVEECSNDCNDLKKEIAWNMDINGLLDSLWCKEKFMQFGKRSITKIDNTADLTKAFEWKDFSNLFFAKTWNKWELIIHNRVDMMGRTVNNEEKITYKIRLSEWELEKFLNSKVGWEKVNKSLAEWKIEDSSFEDDLAEMAELWLDKEFDVDANNKLIETKILENFPEQFRPFIKVSFEAKNFDLENMNNINEFSAFKKSFWLDWVTTQREISGMWNPILYPIQDLNDWMPKIVIVKSVPIKIQFWLISWYNEEIVWYIDPSKLSKDFGTDANLWYSWLEKANI